MLNKDRYIVAALGIGIEILLVSLGYCQPLNNDTKKNCLCWNENLTFQKSHFKNESIPREALINTSIAAISSLSIEVIPLSNCGKITFEVYNIFNMDSAWISSDSINNLNDILEHEKIHFDISEVFARKLRKRLSSFLAEREYDGIKINEIVDEILLKEAKEQVLFDNESNFGLNLEKQRQWEDKIGQKLKTLQFYSLSSEINCPCRIIE